MTVAEIIILIVGAIVFTASFFIPDKGDNAGSGTVSGGMEERAVKELVEKEIDKYRISLEEATQESIDDKKDMLERYMDRLANEKMMAVNEYSDTVLAQIKKDHEEAVFLYDMIDSKHTQVKNTTAEINQTIKSVKQLQSETENAAAKSASKTTEEVKEVKTKKKTDDVATFETSESTFEPLNVTKVEVEQKKAPKSTTKKSAAKKAKDTANTSTEKSDSAVVVDNASNGEVELMFDSDNNGANNNDRILALHKEGKSNMAIAKELGLGIGEVKLVIDLFEGI
ncbi:MAG: hypothetical protein KBT19_05695 [Lachnospiraceae bacterium]|nr:hypothetical protein [Candidatus Colinaster equi]